MIEKCSLEGSRSASNSCKFRKNINGLFGDFCKNSFELSCFEKLEEMRCQNGIKEAKNHGTCDNAPDESKVSIKISSSSPRLSEI